MPNIIQRAAKKIERNIVREIRRTNDQIVETAGRVVEGVQKAASAPVRGNFDENPFNDGQVGIELSGGGLSVNVKGGLFPAGNLAPIGISVGAKLNDVGGIDASLGIGGVPGIRVENADGRAIITTDPFEVIGEGIRGLIDVTEVEINKRTNRKREEENNRNRRPPQPGTRSRDSVLRPSGAQPGTSSRNRQTSQPTSQPRSPNLPGGTAQTIPSFPVQGADEMAAADEISRQRSGGGRLAPEPFQIPTEVPRTNTRLPNKPQIGGSRPSSRSQSGGKRIGGSGGMALGPGNSNNQNPSSGGKRIVRPEDMEDLSPNSPTNKPRINQPAQNNEPRTPKRMLSPQERGLFDCLNNGGGDACYKKFNQQKPSSNQASNSGGANIELEFGDPYIGMGVD